MARFAGFYDRDAVESARANQTFRTSVEGCVVMSDDIAGNILFMTACNKRMNGWMGNTFHAYHHDSLMRTMCTPLFAIPTHCRSSTWCIFVFLFMSDSVAFTYYIMPFLHVYENMAGVAGTSVRVSPIDAKPLLLLVCVWVVHGEPARRLAWSGAGGSCYFPHHPLC